MKPSCFVIMPFRKKQYQPAGSGTSVTIDFDAVYEQIIRPAIEDAGMEPMRADKEELQGSIHKPMFERIILSEYVVADLTGANANVFYELGIRHAVKPWTTVSIFAGNSPIPFDLSAFRALPYDFSEAEGLPNAASTRQAITAMLQKAKEDKFIDSPVFQLVQGYHFHNSATNDKTEVFRDRVAYDRQLGAALKAIRNSGELNAGKLAALEAFIAEKLSPLEDQESGVLVDALLSYRDIGATCEMEAFVLRLPLHLQRTVMVREQYAFALNRNGRREEAIGVLEALLREHGPSSETYGLLGGVYKDYVHAAFRAGDEALGFAYLEDALEAYRKGFEYDWKDAYPGVNYAMLLALKGAETELASMLPVVEYAVVRKKERADRKPDYWDEATLAEIALIRRDYAAAARWMTEARKRMPHAWMLETTRDNLRLLLQVRTPREDVRELAAFLQRWFAAVSAA
ncbi:MAG: DUF4071 domain-containing protein [Chitinophagaceae bacterium]|nr:MAG: DUF4071 domain-containing protein [Chitinophagaceae bacterium]